MVTIIFIATIKGSYFSGSFSIYLPNLDLLRDGMAEIEPPIIGTLYFTSFACYAFLPLILLSISYDQETIKALKSA